MPAPIRIAVHDDKHFQVTVDPTAPSSWRLSAVVRRFPEQRWHADGYFTVPATEVNIDYLKAHFRADEYELDADAQVFYDYVTKTIALAQIKEKRRWKYLFNDEVPQNLPFKFQTTPYKHQLVALDALHGQEFFALFMEMGTGKTKVIIDELYACAKEHPGYRVLILAPRTVLRTWEKEFDKHLRPDCTRFVKRIRNTGVGKEGGIQVMLDGMQSKADLVVFLCNYEKTGPLLDAFTTIGLDIVVADESTRIKGYRANRSANARAIAAIAKRRVILTGTPITNGVFDLFSQFEFLNPGSLGYSTRNAFREAHSHVQKIHNWEQATGYKALDDLKKRVARHAFLVTKDQCLDLPAKSYDTREVDMGPHQREYYDQMVEWFMAEMTDEVGNKGTVEARSFLSKLLRLSQITQGFCRTPDGTTIPIDDGNGKLDELMDIIDDLPLDRKIIVWARFHYDIEAISKALEERQIEYRAIYGGVSQDNRDKAVDDFNATNNVRVLVGEPGTGGLGLTLLGSPEMPCHTAVYYSNDYSLEKRLQSEDRCHRIGQKHPVTYIDIVCEDSIDQHIAQKLQDKRNLCDEVKDMDSIKEFLLTR